MDPIRSGLTLARNLTLRGFPTVLVGGAVRDLLLGLPPRDADLATAAPPEILEDLFPSLRRLDRPGGTTFLLPGPGGILRRLRLQLRSLLQGQKPRSSSETQQIPVLLQGLPDLRLRQPPRGPSAGRPTRP